VLVFGPDRLSPSAMAEVISDVLGRPVAYRQVSLADFGSTLSQRGASEDLMHAVAVAPTSALLSNEIAVAVLAVQPVAGVIYD
jgi:uncharacterized protein YbjT (DUF2867 family)